MRYALILVVFVCLGLVSVTGCDKSDADKANQEAEEGQKKEEASLTAGEKACRNLNKIAGEPVERCMAELPAFEEQCPEQIDETLTCLAEAKSEADLGPCTQACMQAGADDIAPPVPEEFDTPELAAACEAVGELSGGGTPAGQEACRRKLAQEAGKCPAKATEFFECYANAETDDAGAECLLMCVEESVKQGQ